jgi:type I restriction enzyme S subunit
MSFSEWREVKVSEIGKIVTGKTPKTAISENYGGNIPFLTPSDDMNIKKVKSTARTLSEMGLNSVKNCLLPAKSICVSCIGSVLGKVVLTSEPTVTNQQINSIVPDEKFDPDFIYYGMTILGKHLNYLSKTSTAVPIINKTTFSNFSIIVPTIEEQKSIAHILSTLDDKIEVNNQINKTLENMAQAIFKQWFVEFEFPNEGNEPYKSSGGEMVESELGMIPKGWEVGKLDDIATVVMGQSPKGTSYNEVGEGEVFYQGRTDFSSRFPIRRLFTTEPKRMANDGDVLMSVRAPVGDLNVANERCCIGRGLSAISSSADLSSYILYVMHDLRERLNVYNGEGTVFGSINQKDLKSIKVISSCDNKTEIAFDELIQPIDRMIRNNEDETRRLINLRDRLLPKLLSGEIRVPLDEEGDAS